MDYYINQSGSGMPVFEGSRGQRGHGLGSILSGLFRNAMPILKRGLAIFGKQALRTGLEVANDVAGGQTLRDSTTRRIPSAIKQGFDAFSSQSGSGKRRKKTSKKTNRSKRIKRPLDIFGN
jgi:hypothetical protein